MALFITTAQVTYEIHRGQTQVCKRYTDIVVDLRDIVSTIIEVQADGDELDRILSWDNMPNNRQRVQIFYGDMAKYIVGNWY